MVNRNIFALLVGVGDYEKLNMVNLPTYKMDLTLIGSAIMSGLKVPRDNVRLMAGPDNSGFITTTDLAKAIAGFRSLLSGEDTFIFYFSGHGRDRNIIFSNGQLGLQSVIDYIEALPAKNKIVILDCCYSGRFETAGARRMSFEDSVSEFAGHGIAVMASSAADEKSRLGPNGNHSMFTGALSTAIALSKKIRKGCLALPDIYAETKSLVESWNKQNPGKEQTPIFRSSMGGTIYFQVMEYQPYQIMGFQRETDRYKIVRVEPLSAPNIKRLCAFVIPKGAGNLTELSAYTKEIAESIKYAEIYSTAASELKFEGTPAKAIWCYFGHDESDLINHLHYAYTIWVADEEMEQLYFKSNKNAVVIDGVYVYENTSYPMLKKMQQPTQTREEFIIENKRLLASIASLAEQFITDLQEVRNKTLPIELMQERYGAWIEQVRKKYLILSEGDIAPNDLHDWTEEIVSLAGWILDLSMILENERHDGVLGSREFWLIDNAIRHYHESLEKLKQIEQNIEF